jgi:hypothetical protein
MIVAAASAPELAAYISGSAVVIAALIGAGASVWTAKVANANRASLAEVTRKVTTPGDGTLGEQTQKVADTLTK